MKNTTIRTENFRKFFGIIMKLVACWLGLAVAFIWAPDVMHSANPEQIIPAAVLGSAMAIGGIALAVFCLMSIIWPVPRWR